MKLTEEKIIHLQGLTGLNGDKARKILEQCGGDELEALLLLEKKGVIAQSSVGRYTTAESATEKRHFITPSSTRHRRERVSDEPLGWGEHIWMLLVGNRLVARHKEDASRRIECPLGALAALLVIAWHVVVVVLVLGLLTGWRYQLVGPQLAPLAKKIMKILRDEEN
jgi:hypothetical protein